MKPDTRVNHPPEVEIPADNRPVVGPIFQSVKFEFDTLDETTRFLRGERGGFFYSRASNPTTRQLELLLAQVQGRDDCLVTSTGVGAIAHALLSLTKQGDHVVCFFELYSPSRYLIRRLLGKFGVTNTMLSIEDLAGIERALAAQPVKLVLFESPTNPVLKVADIEAIARLARGAGALTVLDNTFAGLHQHGDYDIDVYIHSLTKYASGAGDVSGGAVIADSKILRGMRSEFIALGGALDPHAAFLIQRGLKTYFLRYREQSNSALRVAQHLSAHPAVARVHYPGLPSHPQHVLAGKQMRDFGAVVTFELKGGANAGARFTEALQYFAIAASLGSTESLIMAPQMMGGRDLTADQLRLAGVTDSTVRLSIGLEAIEDLLEDIDRGLEAASRA